ncbi:MAG: hypothetical protein AAF847_07230 [Bacteroidota bacterium]
MKNIMLALSATLLCLMLTNSDVKAQYSPEYTTYKDSSIYIQNLGAINAKFVQNNRQERIGFLGRNLQPILEVYPNAIVAFKKYRVNNNIGNVLTVTGLGLLAASLNYTDSENIIRHTNLLSIGAITTSVGGFFKWGASNQLQRSIDVYNQDLLNSKAFAPYSPEYNIYQDSSMYLLGRKFVLGNEKKSIGFMGKNLKPILQVSPNATVAFKKYRTNKAIANVLTTVGIVLAVLADDNNNSESSIGNPMALSIGLVSVTTASLFENVASNHLNRAAVLYNQDLLR